MKTAKIRKIILFIIIGLIIVGGVAPVILGYKINQFHKDVRNSSFDYNGGKYPGTNIIFSDSDFTMITSWILTAILLSFTIFAIIYAYDKKDTSKIIRKWPYIVLVVLFAIGSALKLFGISAAMKDTIKMDSSIPGEVQDQINKIWQDSYLAMTKLISIINLVLTTFKLAVSILLLILTIKIKGEFDIKYSNKVRQVNKTLNQENDLP